MIMHQFLITFYARRKAIFLILFSSILLGVTVALLLPQNYKATATVVLDYKGIDPVTGITIPASLMPNYISNQKEIITSKKVAVKVVDDLKLTENDLFKTAYEKNNNNDLDIRYWIANKILKRIEVSHNRDTSLVDISYKDVDQKLAESIVNAFVAAYQKTTVELKVSPSRSASSFFQGQIKTLRDDLENAQAKLSRYQKEKGIFNQDTKSDVETARMNELSTQLVTLQSQLMDAKSRESRAQAHGAIDSREADNNALIQNLKSDITRAESRLDYTSRFFTKDHPRYQASEAEVLKLRAELNKQLRTTSNSLTNEAVVIEKRVAEIRNALEVQKIKVQDLNRARNEFAVLTKEVENAQNAYSSATQRFSQTKLEGQSLQSDIAVLDSAISVRSEILPRLIKMLLMSTFAGLFLGLGYAVAAEWRDRRVRSLADFAHISDLSALGVMEMQMSTQPRFRLAGIVPFRPQLPK